MQSAFQMMVALSVALVFSCTESSNAHAGEPQQASSRPYPASDASSMPKCWKPSAAAATCI